jgi:integrase
MPQHVFVNTAGKPQRPDGVMREVFRDACTALQLRGQAGRAFTPHCLRDSFATGHLMARKDVGWVAMMLGHASEETTLRYYYKWVRQAAVNPLANEAD